VRGGFSLFEPNFGLLVALEGALSKHWAAWLVLAVERDLLGNHFDVVREGERVAALKPLPVLPVVRVGLRWCP
jgi:hypothetical protein